MKRDQGTDDSRVRQTPAFRRMDVFLPWCVILVAGCALLAHSLEGQTPKPSEYQVKAAYLYNFGRFVEWPAKVREAKSDAFPICVLGQDPFGPTLNAILAGETIDGTNVVTNRVSNPKDAVNCRILFISSSEDIQLKEILEALDNSSVLTVSDMPQFSRRGGMVQFVLDGNRVRFEVNLAPALHAGLTVSSELLKLAVSVRPNAGTGN